MSQTTHLIRRSGVWNYRRRVPVSLVQKLGKKIVQFSLNTASLKEAKRRRALEDVRWDARFRVAADPTANPAKPGVSSEWGGCSSHSALAQVQEFVTRLDDQARQQALAAPPVNTEEREEMREDIETGIGILRDRSDPRGDQWIDQAERKTIKDPASASASLADAGFAEIVRRGLIELQRRKLARIDDRDVPFFDHAFDPSKPADVTFAALAQQYLEQTEEEANINRTSRKWVDKQKANIALLSEVIGANTFIRQIDYDACMRVRSVLSRLPAHRSKLYAGLSVDDAIALRVAEQRPALAPATQAVYLSTLREILDLALKKGLVAVSPAQGMKPLRKDDVVAGAKRLPFTPDQLKSFFEGGFYRACSGHNPPWAHDKRGWRFWLPLLCLYMGMRPNEACQMAVADVRRTKNGTWYLDVVASDDDDEEGGAPKKVLKTATSRRRIPVHPALMALGFLEYVETRRKSEYSRLFPHLKPDSYGNHAKYALKRFRESFLPAEIELAPRQSFYSFRHNFRDALRAIEAPPDALQALGGWSQGKLTSDAYGDVFNPDYQLRFMERVCFPTVELSRLSVSS